ncbi:MAG: LSm family protein [Candidatus Nezhaarchaeota archaeon]|nr:LSm family protein [Candidatus Nezhaarchaeota archaeon]
MSETTLAILASSIGSQILVRLKGGKELRGRLKSYDQHLNIVLEDAEELKQNGEPKKHGLILIRGDSIVLISPVPK